MSTQRRNTPTTRHRLYGHQRDVERASVYRIRNPEKVALELVVLKEWEHVQRRLFSFALTAPSPVQAGSWRDAFEDCIAQATAGRARIWWEVHNPPCPTEQRQLIEIRYQKICYGILDLDSDYLASSLLPWIPKSFARLCALLLALAEYRALVQCLLKQLSVDVSCDPLTNRMYDVLLGLAYGECESDMAQRLGIELTTLRTHRHRLYQCLDVHSTQEAILKSFALRLLDWLDIPIQESR